jgi:hypothetical protein
VQPINQMCNQLGETKISRFTSNMNNQKASNVASELSRGMDLQFSTWTSSVCKESEEISSH